MIHRIHLRNWRSYEDLDLRLNPGTTFVVAPNGVGKTSLVYGLAWAVFGGHSNVDPRACIRAGAEGAEVQVEFDLPDGRRFNIRRAARRRGAPTATYEMNGTRLTESSALTEMEQALRIELPVASRLSMMLGGGHIAANDTLSLEGHLHHAFGVTHLLGVAQTAQSVAKEAEKARAVLRSTTRQRMETRAVLEGEIAGLEAQITHLKQRGTELEQVRDSAAAQRSLVERHLALAGQLERYEQQRSRLLATIEDLLGRPVASDTKESISSELRTELEKSERAVAEMTEGAITARSVITVAEQAVRLLDRDHTVCPTCLRPLPSHQRLSAISAHRTQRADAQMEARRLEETRAARHTHANAVSKLLAQLDALQPPSIDAGVDNVPTRAAAEALYQQASAALDEHNQQLGGMQSRLESLKAQIATDDQILQEERHLRLAYRREAAAFAGARVLSEAANHVIESRIEPLASEVRARWKHLFTNNGLTFRPDGSITRLRGDEELGWDTLSGGERTWARIVTHLIVIATTTSLPFAWFDEPLEHLDPQLRHAVAATLATATVGGSPRQLLVTTYEHGIAQQLADDTNGAGIITIRESDASFDPH
ncbi:MAG: AAA family ATPase [Deltaproteobacteria bacterium]|nr:AAA family ATPase [Deltaproteobacteria bacterium]